MQVARALKMQPENVRIRVTVRFYREGSVIQRTTRTVCDSVKTELWLDSDEPRERIAHLIEQAEASCYTMAALRDPVAAELSVVLNGERFQP